MALCNVYASEEEYRGEKYRLEKREIWSLYDRRYRTVWCWEVLTGPAQGVFGGKQATKGDARYWAKHTIRAWRDAATRRVTA